MMKRTVIGYILLGWLLMLAAAGCGAQPTPVKPTPTAAPAGKGILAGERIIAEGKVTPAKDAALSFPISGIVKQVPVALGAQVKAGQVLAQLDTQQLELQLAEADAKLAAAQGKLNQLKRGPTAEELAAAQQNLASAQAAYDGLTHPSANDLTALKADMDKA